MKEINVTESDGALKIAPDNFLNVWGFMLTDLKLAKTELLVYAVIFSMYRNYCAPFNGSRAFLQKWSNSGHSAVEKALASLLKKGLITKMYEKYDNMSKAVYLINTEKLPSCEMFAIENRRRDALAKIRKNTDDKD